MRFEARVLPGSLAFGSPRYAVWDTERERWASRAVHDTKKQAQEVADACNRELEVKKA